MGLTDKNGLAVINYDEDQIERIENDRNLFVYVVNGKDKAAAALLVISSVKILVRSLYQCWLLVYLVRIHQTIKMV